MDGIHLTPDRMRTNGYGIDSIVHFALQKNPIKYRYLLSKDDQELAREIFKNILLVFDVTEEELKSQCRKRELVIVRYIFYYLTKTISGLTLLGIGRFLDKKEHTTIIHGIKTVRDLIQMENPGFMPYWNRWLDNAPSYLVP